MEVIKVLPAYRRENLKGKITIALYQVRERINIDITQIEIGKSRI